MKKTWEGIGELIGRQKKYPKSISAVRANSSSPLVNNLSKIANIINFHFASCGHHLAAKLPHSKKHFSDYLTFPTKLKIAKVIPIFKAGDAKGPNNYRPISLLSIFNKTFEKLIYKRLNSYLVSKEIISEPQYGFREKHSTCNYS